MRACGTKKVGWVWKVWVANGPIGSGKNVESSTVVEKPTNHPRGRGRVKRRRRSVCPSRARYEFAQDGVGRRASGGRGNEMR